jgi:hypothetical protein
MAMMRTMGIPKKLPGKPSPKSMLRDSTLEMKEKLNPNTQSLTPQASFFTGISSRVQVATSKLQVKTFMKKKCEPVPNFSIENSDLSSQNVYYWDVVD